MKIRIVLAIVFVWSLGKSLDLLARSGSVDRVLFEGVGLPWLFWAFLLPLALLQGAAIVFLIRPSVGVTYRMAQLAVGLNVLETVVAAFLSVGNPELLKKAIVASRTARGLPVREEVLWLAESSAAQIFPVIISVAFGCLWIVLLARVRRLSGTTASAVDGSAVPAAGTNR